MLDDVPHVVLRAVDETRFPAAEDRESEHVQARCVDDAAVMAQIALLVDGRDMEPTVIGTKTGGPHDGAHFAARQFQRQRRASGYHRRLWSLGRAFDLAEIREIKNRVENATVNDVVLAICGGALARYLRAKGELTDDATKQTIREG